MAAFIPRLKPWAFPQYYCNEMDFPSPSDFGKYFKRLTGTSPLSYRKANQRLKEMDARRDSVSVM